MRDTVVLGSRGSKLALQQAAIASKRLTDVHPSLTVGIRSITTAGDRDPSGSLSAMGGKGVFVRDLELALLAGEIDIAVHSFKDITVQIHTGLELCAFFPPESVCDVLVSKGDTPLDRLPQGAVIGTGSLRRRVLLSRLRPDLRFSDIRGNIDTRIRKLDEGMYHGIVLAEAGLVRLGLTGRIAQRFDPQTFFPAPGQGVITLEIRRGDSPARDLCAGAGDTGQDIRSLAELSILECVGFDCRTPFGVYTRLTNDSLSMDGFYVNPHTGAYIERHASGAASAPATVGRALGRMLLEGGE